MMNALKLIIADDHAVFRQGLKSLLATYPKLEVVAEVEKAADLEHTVAEISCDLIVLDLQMDHWVMDKIAALARRAHVVVLTASESGEDASAALRLGARAVVQKRFALETLIAAIQAVAEGLIWLPPTSPAELEHRSGRAAGGARLTPRELAIVKFVAEGLRNAEVAAKLAITEGTVKIQLNRIFHKVGVRDRVELANYAFRNGLVKVKARY